ncbi:conserved hypothetical protein [Deferribacter desulfuricans SSM1]|uniref:Sulfatase N-terminal domain-containing protein n=1 Tax=Deferribacter desulfuricans (strain DSM 14783 / JCM 11476 / NBRC 101012 / SSM1) TaxID=639282 RepID=D3PDE1_DEFDS|nr:sulfatase-like hydrolase/transferase [Deferribacter desulfuricans]BAI80614.1 conserved hypothetical protein [Deferribacter desulfuricans SSM1]
MKEKYIFIVKSTFLNFLFISLLFSFYFLSSLKNASTILAKFYLIGSYLSSSFTFSLIPFLLTSIFALFFNKKITKALFFIFSFIVVTFIFVDFAIYRIYGFHFNGMVVAMITTPGFFDSVSLGAPTLISVIFILVAFLVVELLIIKKSGKLNISSKKILLIFLLLIIITASERLTFAISDLYNKRDITRLSKVYPLYQPLTIRGFAKRVLHFNVNREFNFKVKKSTLKYPQTEIVAPDVDKTTLPNILVIAIDSYRFDMLNPRNSPNIYNFSKNSLVFQNHYSGGNSTRFGIFSLFYGLYGYWWHDFLANRQSPVLISTLKKMGYKFKILSATSLTFPEFRKTVFLDIPESIEDDFGKRFDRVQRESALVESFKKFRELHNDNSPYFSFIFFDAPHARAFPKKYNIFKTKSGETNYLIIGKRNITKVKNAYMNAVYYDDALVKEILDYLKEKGDLKNTIIVITGDHGEEFYENGHFGHNNSFTEYQVRVPFVFYIPWMKHKDMNYITTHYDFVPTIFDLLGIKADKKGYTFGNNMLKPIDRDYIISCNWSWCAIIDKEGYRLLFSYETHKSFDISLYNKEYKEVKDKKIFNEKKKFIFHLINQFNQFY